MASFDVPSFDRRNIEQWIQRDLSHQHKYGFGVFSVILKGSGTLIGDCGLQRMEIAGEQIVELGYEFRSDYWRQGYATEAAAAVRDYAFYQLHLPKLTSLVRVGNLAAARVSEKIGMTLRGEITLNQRSYRQYSMQEESS